MLRTWETQRSFIFVLRRNKCDEGLPRSLCGVRYERGFLLRILIVVLNWNSRDMTKECIQSLLAMQGDSFKILVIDNGSRDGSVEYLRETFPQIDVTANGRNLGFAAGCNVGMKRAVAENFEYVLLVNNDTI